MSMLGLLAVSGSDEKLYVDDVFASHTYTGNGLTQTINNGIDLAGNGGLVWIKNRDVGYTHVLANTTQGFQNSCSSNTTTAASDLAGAASAFNSNGFSLSNYQNVNSNAATYVSWTFRKATKFFDIVTWTGDGTSNRAIPHALGTTAGIVMTKATSTTGDWNTYHRSATGDLVLNTTAAQTGSHAIVVSATDSTFTVTGVANTNGVTYVAYIFAHDTSTDGIVQCGSFTTDGSGNATVNLGWEPQYLLIKNSTGGADSWRVTDTSRELSVTNAKALYPNLSDAESGNQSNPRITSTGFYVSGYTASTSYIYLTIRRSNKPPTTGTQVYNAIARTGTGAAATVTGVGFAPDLVIAEERDGTYLANLTVDRLRGVSLFLSTNKTDADSSGSNEVTALTMDGMTVGTSTVGIVNASTRRYINHFFKRAVGVMDIVCYTGTGSATTVAHGLGVVPELMIVKKRSGTNTRGWAVYHAFLGNSNLMLLDMSNSVIVQNVWNNTTPTASVLSVSNDEYSNASASTYVAYLFASKSGISKVGSYTGGGNLLTYSEQFDNAAWTKSNATITANATTAPDGTLTADKLVENTVNTLHYTNSSVISNSGTNTYTASIYVKSSERNFSIWLRNSDGSANYCYVVFDTTNKTILSAPSAVGTGYASPSATITDVGNGWVRCTLTVAISVASFTMWARLFQGSSAGYTGDGTSGVFIWGAQLEKSSSVTTYTPTTDVAPALKIDMGFTTGARFFMCKSVSTTGDWLVADTTRGIVSGSDGRLSLNSTAAEVTTEDWVDNDNTGSGIIVNQTACNANVAGVQYIYLAFA